MGFRFCQTRPRGQHHSKFYVAKIFKVNDSSCYVLIEKMDKENKYFTWTNEQLKQELKRRGLRNTGKKKNLQERLIFADENKGFFQLHQQDPDAVFWTPDNTQYRDINASTKIPLITNKQIELFLQRYNVLKNLGKEMYENQYLLHARIAQSNGTNFIQGHCFAQMKKSVQYKCDIQMSNTGFIEGTHCECAVGGGDTAHCKHVAVLLWAMEEMVIKIWLEYKP